MKWSCASWTASAVAFFGQLLLRLVAVPSSVAVHVPRAQACPPASDILRSARARAFHVCSPERGLEGLIRRRAAGGWRRPHHDCR